MNTTLYFDQTPIYFTLFIPCKLEIDGVLFPLQNEIQLGELSKNYGHFRLRLIFFGIVKSKPTIVSANNKFIHLKIALIRHKLPTFTLAMMAANFPIVYHLNTRIMAYAFLIFIPITYMLEALVKLVEIRETKPSQ
ncbi:hypothetical protein [Aquirufa sp. Wall-65K1]